MDQTMIRKWSPLRRRLEGRKRKLVNFRIEATLWDQVLMYQDHLLRRDGFSVSQGDVVSRALLEMFEREGFDQ